MTHALRFGKTGHGLERGRAGQAPLMAWHQEISLQTGCIARFSGNSRIPPAICSKNRHFSCIFSYMSTKSIIISCSKAEACLVSEFQGKHNQTFDSQWISTIKRWALKLSTRWIDFALFPLSLQISTETGALAYKAARRALPVGNLAPEAAPDDFRETCG